MAHDKQAQRGSSCEVDVRGEAPDLGPASDRIGGGAYAHSPFAAMRRLSDSMDKLFSSFFSPNPEQSDQYDAFASQNDVTEASVWPEIEVQHSGNRFLLHVAIPGVNKEDIRVQFRDHALSVCIERPSESGENDSFSRVIPLPEGAKVETTSATLEDGVLRIELEAPVLTDQSRSIEVRDGSPH